MKNLLLIVLLGLTSCITLNVPSDQDKASVKLHKTTTLTKQIVTTHPDLVDSVRQPVRIKTTTLGDTSTTKLEVDSARIADFFERQYLPLIDRKNELIQKLESGFLSTDDRVRLLDSLKNTEQSIESTMFQVTRAVQMDTSVLLSITTPLILNKDTINIVATADLTVKNGNINLEIYIPPQTDEVNIETTTPIFLTKDSRNFLYILFLAIILGMLVYIIKTRSK